MKDKGVLGNLHPFGRLMLLLILCFGSLLVVTFIGVAVMVPFWGREILEMLLGSQELSLESQLRYMQYLQILTHIGLFVIPSLVFAWLIARRPFSYLQADHSPYARSLIYSILIMIAALPMVSFLMELNMRLNLPEFMAPVEEWMVQAEERAGETTKLFLNVTTWQGLLFNIFMIAVIPAIGEEFIFRGVLLKTFSKWSSSPHFAVWISAIIFSAIHLQFFGFLPRLMLGAVLGYMMIFTGNIWIPVVAHFFNNALAVVFYFLFYNGYINFDIEQAGREFASNDSMYLLAFGSLILIIFLFWIMRDNENRLNRRSTFY